MLKITDNKLTDKLTTTLGMIAGITEILIEFDYIDRRFGGVVLGISLLFWGLLTNRTSSEVEAKWRNK